jgi:hypothetical protein
MEDVLFVVVILRVCRLVKVVVASYKRSMNPIINIITDQYQLLYKVGLYCQTYMEQ